MGGGVSVSNDEGDGATTPPDFTALAFTPAEIASMAGALPEDAAELLQHALGRDRLSVRGLMAIPPWGRDPEESRPHFRALRELRDDLQLQVGAPLPELSMGMSHDFELAIAEGATMVRVGTAIFGPRG